MAPVEAAAGSQQPQPPSVAPPPPARPSSWVRRRLLAARARSARFTTEGTRFVLFTVAVGIAAINTGNNLFYLLVAMMLSLITMSGLLSELCLRRLQVSCHAPDHVYTDTAASLTVAVTNPRPHFPSFSLRVAEIVAGRPGAQAVPIKHLPAGATVLVSLPIVATTRGRYRLDGIQVATPFPFGLFVKRLVLPHPMSLIVLPRPQPVTDPLLADLASAGADRVSARRGPGTDLYNLRLYQPGDDSRLIHWMSTARTSQLIVRETQADTHPRVTLSLIPHAPAEHRPAFERAVTLAASLAAYFLAHHFQVTVEIGTDRVSTNRGADELPQLLKPLALCDTQGTDAAALEAGVAAAAANRRDQDGPVVAIFAWSTPALDAAWTHASRIMVTTDDARMAAPTLGAPHGTGTRVSA